MFAKKMFVAHTETNGTQSRLISRPCPQFPQHTWSTVWKIIEEGVWSVNGAPLCEAGETRASGAGSKPLRISKNLPKTILCSEFRNREESKETVAPITQIQQLPPLPILFHIQPLPYPPLDYFEANLRYHFIGKDFNFSH